MSRIARFRQRRKISQKRLAEKVGVSQPTVCDWELKKKVPTGDNLRALSRELGVRPSTIMADYYDSQPMQQ